MVGWHHRLNGHEFEQAPGDGEGQDGKKNQTKNKNKYILTHMWKQEKWYR